MRPIYESDGDLSNELAIAKEVSASWSCDVKKLPRSYHLDFAIFSRKTAKLVAWAEIKRRFRTFDQYPDTFLSMNKVFAAHHYKNVTKKPCFFIVQFNDYLCYADMLLEYEIGFGGRVDRGDWQDVEPLALILPEHFTMIPVKEHETASKETADQV